MIPTWFKLSPLVPIYGPCLAAFAVAAAGTAVRRRAEAWWPVAGALAVLVGWMLLLPMPGPWWHPRALPEHLVGAAVAGVGAAVAGALVSGRLRSWTLALGLGLAAWWLAGAPGVRTEFWRVWFAVAAVTWLLRLLGGRSAAGLATVGLVLAGGGALSAAPALWIGAAAVLAGTGLGAAAVKPDMMLGTVAPAAGLVALDLGTGAAMRGRVGTMDLMCGASLLAPLLLRPLQRRLGPRFGRGAWMVACMVAAAAAIGVAKVGGLLVRG